MNDEKVTFKCVIEELEKERDNLAEINKVLSEALEKMRPVHSIACHQQECASYCLVDLKIKTLAKAKEMGK